MRAGALQTNLRLEGAKSLVWLHGGMYISCSDGPDVDLLALRLSELLNGLRCGPVLGGGAVCHANGE